MFYVTIIVIACCCTILSAIKLGTRHVERIEKIRHGYPVDGAEPKLKDITVAFTEKSKSAFEN